MSLSLVRLATLAPPFRFTGAPVPPAPPVVFHPSAGRQKQKHKAKLKPKWRPKPPDWQPPLPPRRVTISHVLVAAPARLYITIRPSRLTVARRLKAAARMLLRHVLEAEALQVRLSGQCAGETELEAILRDDEEVLRALATSHF